MCWFHWSKSNLAHIIAAKHSISRLESTNDFHIFIVKSAYQERILVLSMFDFAAYVSVHTETEMETDTGKSGKSHSTYFAWEAAMKGQRIFNIFNMIMFLLVFPLPLSAIRLCFSTSEFLDAFCFYPLKNYSQQTCWLFSIRNCILTKLNVIEMMVGIRKYRSTKETKAQSRLVRGTEAASWINSGTNESIFRN